jgi:hypothetical protein
MVRKGSSVRVRLRACLDKSTIHSSATATTSGTGVFDRSGGLRDEALVLEFALQMKQSERRARLTGLVLVGVIVCASLIGAPTASAGTHTREVDYHGYGIDVPRSWPVYELAADPSRCVRFDRHAVYLGQPGANQRCPAHAVGRTEAILIEPLGGVAAQHSQPDALTLSGRRVRPRSLSSASSNEALLAIPSAGVQVTATWRRDHKVVKGILHGARRVAGGQSTAPAPARPHARRARRRHQPALHRPGGNRGQTGRATASYYTGLGFDACTAPSTTTMTAWATSPYRGIGIYIGGANRGCSQPNLTSTWVSTEIAAGWQLIPTYVGLQAPSNNCGCAAIKPAQAGAQGIAAADDAVTRAAAVGIGLGNPIYFDMEGYSRGGTNSPAVLTFLGAWTGELHARGYVSGIYSSAASGIADLVAQYGSGFAEPDDLWVADWNNQATTVFSYIPVADWANHQRLHQYRGGHNESYGGVSINIDNDYLDGALVGNASPPVVVRRGHCPKVFFKHHSKYGAFDIRTFNVLHPLRCGKARKVAAASRAKRFGALGGARVYRRRGFTCRGSTVGRARVIYVCRTGRAQIRFVRAD